MIKIIDGNLFNSKANIICHQTNTYGIMGSGVAAEVKKRYPKVFNSYRKDFENGLLKLGYVNFTTAKQNQVIANMCGQDKFGYDGKQYTDYEAFRECCQTIVKLCRIIKSNTVAMPYKIGSDRGGADWDKIMDILLEEFTDVDLTLYKL